MHVWLRGIAAAAAGLAVAIVLIMAVRALGLRLYPLPPDVDLADPADMARVLRDAPAGLLTLAGFANLAAIPHPAWFAFVSTVTYLPCALLGVLGVQRRRGVVRRA